MKHITLNEARQTNGMEGLVIQGCGGGLNEWIDGSAVCSPKPEP